MSLYFQLQYLLSFLSFLLKIVWQIGAIYKNSMHRSLIAAFVKLVEWKINWKSINYTIYRLRSLNVWFHNEIIRDEGTIQQTGNQHKKLFATIGNRKYEVISHVKTKFLHLFPNSVNEHYYIRIAVSLFL